MQSPLFNLGSGARGQQVRRSAGQFFVVFFLLFSACAKVGDPLPPLVVPPDAISDVETVRRTDHLQIVFSLPPQKIQWVELYRTCGTSPLSPEDATMLGRTAVDEIPLYQSGDRRFLEDQPGTNQVCSYWLQFVNSGGLRSPFSNPAGTFSPTP